MMRSLAPIHTDPTRPLVRRLATSSRSVEYLQHVELEEEEPLVVGNKSTKPSSTQVPVQRGEEEEEILDAGADPEWRKLIQAELPIVTEDILSYYDEIGRTEVRTRYRDNVRFEAMLVQSRMRSAHEVSTVRSARREEEEDHHITSPPRTISVMEAEDSAPLVIVEDLDEITAPPADGTTGRNETNMERPLKLMDGTASLVSSYKTISDEIVEAIILLRTITEQEWIEFDYPQDVVPSSGEGQEEAEDTGSVNDEDSTSASDPNFDMSDADQVKADLDRGERLAMISDRIKSSNKHLLSQDDYNLVLARLAVATELLPDEILTRLVMVFEQMKRFGQPDATTYEVVLLALGRRFAASPMAASYVMDVTADVEWSAKMIEAAAAICEHRNHHQLAQKLLEAMEGSSVWVPKKAYRSLLEFAKIDDRRDYALRIMNHALDVSKSKLFACSGDFF
jgi:hypothetical protein